MASEATRAALAPQLARGETSEIRQAVALKKDLVNKVKGDPLAASRLIQNWLREAEPNK
jgi:hypothetical protein